MADEYDSPDGTWACLQGSEKLIVGSGAINIRALSIPRRSLKILGNWTPMNPPGAMQLFG
jgi:hypothetical protein